jgi:hypothetical protein
MNEHTQIITQSEQKDTMATKDQKLTTTFILLFVIVFFCMFHQTVAFVFSLNWKRNDIIKRTTTGVSTTLDAALRSSPLRTRCSSIHRYYRLYRSPHLLYNNNNNNNNQVDIISLSPLFLARKRDDFGGGPLEEDYGRNVFFETREFEKSTLPTEFEYDPIIPLEPEDNTISFFRNDGNGYNDNGGEKNTKKKKQNNDNDRVYTKDWDYEDDIDYQDYYYDDDDDDDGVVMDPKTSIKRGARNQREGGGGGGRTRTQDIYDEDENNENVTGNFWTNPVGGMDFRERQTKNQHRPSTRRTFPPPKTFMNDAKKMQRKTFRSGNPPPPNIIKEFYDRLFWYGFDPDETTSAADRTMFGGTRGKFDGLGLLQDIEEEQSSSRNKGGRGNRKRLNGIIKGQKRPQDDFYDNDYDDEWFDYGDADNYNDDNVVISANKRNISRQRKSSNGKDGFDDEYDLYYDSKGESTRGRRLRKSKRLDVSNWFEEDDEEEEEEYVIDGKSNESPKEGGKLSPIVNILDSVFQIDADQVKYQAEDYNRRLGLDRKARFSTSNSSPSSSYTTATTTTTTTGRAYDTEPKKQRKGYAYRYVTTDKARRQEMDDSSWLDQSTVMDDDNAELKTTNAKEQETDVIDVDATVQIDSSTTRQNKKQSLENGRKQKEQSWEERAAAYERVPPKGILAWGPEGEIEGGIDARTYAAKKAMEEIFTARTSFEKKETVVSDAERELLQLKKEASIQKKLLLSMEDRRKLPIIRDRLRMINFDIEDAARQLRRAKAEALAAIDKLESIEFRHWALLRQYEADQELEEKQRLQLPKNNLNGT